MNIGPDPAANGLPETNVASPSAVSPPEPMTPGTKSPGSWSAWIRQGLKAGIFRHAEAPSDTPTALQMLVIAGSISITFLLLTRFEIAGEAHFAFNTWLWSWAPSALAMYGVWLILNSRRDFSKHTTSTAAWFLLSAVSGVPLGVVFLALNVVMAHFDKHHGLYQSITFVVAIYLAYFLLNSIVAWRVARALNGSRLVVAGVVAWLLVVMIASTTYLRTNSWEPDYADSEFGKDRLL